jgi:hypothetical protein
MTGKLWKHKRFDHKFPTQYYKNDGNFKTVESFSNVIDLAAAKRTFLCYFIINLLDNIIREKLIILQKVLWDEQCYTGLIILHVQCIANY